MFWIQITTNGRKPTEKRPTLPTPQVELNRQVGDLNIRSACSGYSLIKQVEQRVIICDLHVPAERLDINWAEVEFNSSNFMQLVGDDIASIVVVDFEKNSITAIRSIASTRAIFYKTESGCCSIASSLSFIRTISGNFQLNEKVLPEFYAYRTVTHPQTLARDVFKLGGGEFLQLDAVSTEIVKRCSQPLPTLPNDTDISVAIAAERTEAILTDSIGRMIRTNESPTVLLSGGLDS